MGQGQCARWCQLRLAGCLPARKGFSDCSNIYQLGSSSGAGCVRLSVLPLCLGRRLLLPTEINVCGLSFYNPFGCSSGSLQPLLVFIVQPWHEQAACSPSRCMTWVGRGIGGGLPPAGKPQGRLGKSHGEPWRGADLVGLGSSSRCGVEGIPTSSSGQFSAVSWFGRRGGFQWEPVLIRVFVLVAPGGAGG